MLLLFWHSFVHVKTATKLQFGSGIGSILHFYSQQLEEEEETSVEEKEEEEETLAEEEKLEEEEEETLKQKEEQEEEPWKKKKILQRKVQGSIRIHSNRPSTGRSLCRS